jgi:hypothetical protein
MAVFVVFEACDECPEDGTRSAACPPTPSRVKSRESRV